MVVNFIDNFLNKITIYRLTLFFLGFLCLWAVILSFLGQLPFLGPNFLFSIFFLVIFSWLINTLFAKMWHTTTNLESVYITSLILALIVTPIRSLTDLPFYFCLSISAQASKYLLNIKRKHLFNPAAFAVVFSYLLFQRSASWWVGTEAMLPFVFLGGILLVRKLKREDLVLSFLAAVLLLILIFNLGRNSYGLAILARIILQSPLLFLAFIMLTEPQTSPPKKIARIFSGLLVGFFFVPYFHLGSFYPSPEMALLAGNIFSYLTSPKEKLILKLKEKRQLAPDIYDFVFSSEQKLNYLPGQYLEWTLDYQNPDSRGNRRYFTIASSPTEEDLRIGVKFNPQSSSFKKALLAMEKGSKITASQLAGDFTLPNDPKKKLVFIAGGIGITPFRSMIKYLLDTKQKKDIILFYSSKTAEEIVYQEIFQKAQDQLDLKVIYTLTEMENIPVGWKGKAGKIDGQMIKDNVLDFKDRLFYLSGPPLMVKAFEQILQEIGVTKKQIITDYFPGY